MKYLDGVLAPNTIKTGVYVNAGRPYFVIGNFLSIIKPGHNPDLLFLSRALESFL